LALALPSVVQFCAEGVVKVGESAGVGFLFPWASVTVGVGVDVGRPVGVGVTVGVGVDVGVGVEVWAPRTQVPATEPDEGTRIPPSIGVS
jgi:hypothetical protein